ncbi:MAG: hypothetical protein ABIM19_07885 [candidate division WOR-3 bacterium]
MFETQIIERTRAVNPARKTAAEKYRGLAKMVAQAVLDGLKRTKRVRRKKASANEPNPRRRLNEPNEPNPRRRRRLNEPNPRRRLNEPNPRRRANEPGIDWAQIGGTMLGATGGHMVSVYATNTLGQRFPFLAGKPWIVSIPAGALCTFLPRAPKFLRAIGLGLLVAGGMSLILPMLSGMMGGGGISDEGYPVISDEYGEHMPITVNEMGEIVPMTMSDYVSAQERGLSQSIAYARVVGWSEDGTPILSLDEYADYGTPEEIYELSALVEE